jgi:cytochrome c oxidase cbb3-type subunit 3
MRMRAVIAATLLIAAAGASCRRATTAGIAAETAARPPVPTPVGPVPGPTAGPPRPDNPFASDPSAAVDGRRLFVQMNCSGCHGGRAGGGMGPSLRDQDWLYGQSDAQIFSSIAEGRAHGMPSWGTTLPESEIWRLVAYVKSLRTDHEPHRPGTS